MALLAFVWTARGDLGDYTREDLTDQMSTDWPKERAKVYHWYKKPDDTKKWGQVWAVCIDLTDKHWRFTTRLGKTNIPDHDNRLATLKVMAGELEEKEGRKPLAAINGNYFTYPQDKDATTGDYLPINLYGAMVSEFKIVSTSWSATNMFIEAADHKFSIEREHTVTLPEDGRRPYTSDGRKVRNATGFYATPPVRYYHGEYFPATGQDKAATYPRSLIGCGENVLVLLVGDGRQEGWSNDVEDRDAVDMMVSLGCTQVAENDGGGSASMWIKNLPSSLAGRSKDQEFINRPADGSPRAVAAGLFVLYSETEWQDRVIIDKNPYETLDEALDVVERGERIDIAKIVDLPATRVVSVDCTIAATNVAPQETPIRLASDAELIVNANVTLRNVAVTEEDGTTPAMVRVGKKGSVSLLQDVWIKGLKTQTISGFTLPKDRDLERELVIYCLEGNNLGNDFGRIDYSTSDDRVAENLDKLIHPSEPDWVAVERKSGTDRYLTWETATVRNGTQHRYSNFDTAVKRIASGDTVEIIRSTALNGSVSIATDCTITAAPSDVREAVLTKAWAKDGISIVKPARVLFKHFAAPEMDISVAQEAVVALAGDVLVKSIVIADDAGVELAGNLTESVIVKTAAIGTEVGTVFGTVAEDVSDEDAVAGAARLRNAADVELAGEVFIDEDGSRRLRWGVAEVADDESVAWFVKGGERRNFASLRMLFTLLDDSADIFIASNCTFAAAVDIPADWTVRMQAAEGTSPNVEVALSGSFTVEGRLSVSNLTFVGAEPPKGQSRAADFIAVSGELTLEDGAELHHFLGCNGTCVVKVNKGGLFTMLDGSVITGCKAGDALGVKGAPVYVAVGGTFNFYGGSIFGCESANGAIYGDVMRSGDNIGRASINVQGSATVLDNVYSTGSPLNLKLIQLNFDLGKEVLSVTGELTGRIYVSVNDTFAKSGKVIGVASAAADDSVTNIVCDAVADCVGAVNDSGKLVWKAQEPPPPPDRVQIGDEKYPTLSAAVAAATNGAVLEILMPIEIVCPNERLTIDKRVTIRAVGDPEDAVVCRIPRASVTYDVAPAFTVAAGGDVTLENVIFGDDREMWPVAFLKVDEGGVLTLGDGAVVRNVRCGEFYNEYKPSQPIGETACAVFSQGQVVMEAGSLVTNCANTYKKSQSAGLLLTGTSSAVDFRGGRVIDCTGGLGGGATIVNGARNHVGGDGEYVGNAPANLTVSGQWQVELTNSFSGVAGHTFRGSFVGDPNVFASVKYEFGDDWESLVEEAARFTNDVTKAVGIAATNSEGTAKYVWRTAFTSGESYTDRTGTVWTAIGELPLQPIPVPVAHSNLVYNGRGQVGVDPSPEGYYELSGDLIATNAGTYQVTATLTAYRFVWEDGSDEPTNITWTIAGVKPGRTPVPVPVAVPGLIYNAAAQTGVVVSVEGAYVLEGNVATNAGPYTATATLCGDDYAWQDGEIGPKDIEWKIAKAKFKMPYRIVFTNCTYYCDGYPKDIPVSYENENGTPAELPAGVEETILYYTKAGDPTAPTAPGEYEAELVFSTTDPTNYDETDLLSYSTNATLRILEQPEPPPPPEPQWEVITNYPSPIAFKSIERVSDTEWKLVVTNRERYCNYRLIWTTDLTAGFTKTGEWEHVVHEGCEVWATNIVTSGGAWFWRAEGAEGTNMIYNLER